MNKVWLILTTLVITFNSSAFAGDASIVGEWITIGRTRGGLGSSALYMSDGAFSQTIGAVVDFTYKETSDEIAITMADATAGTSETFRYAKRQIPEGFQVFDVKASTSSFIIQRAGGNQPNSLLGKWRFPHYTGKDAFWEFYSDGLGLMTVPFRTENGTYSADGKQLTVTTKGRGARHFKYEITGNQLTTISERNSKKDVFARKKPN